MLYRFLRLIRIFRIIARENSVLKCLVFVFCRLFSLHKKFILVFYGEKFSFRTSSPDIETAYEAWRELHFLSELTMPNHAAFREGLIIDAGAYAGFTSRYLSRFFPNSKILAIEPSQDNYAALVKNISLSPRSNIDPINKALTDVSGEVLTLTRSGSDLSHSITNFRKTQNVSVETIESVNLGKLLQHAGAESVSILKSDIEGAEFQVFKKMSVEIRVVIIELHERKQPGVEEVFRQYSEERVNIRSGEKVVSFLAND